MQSGSNLFLWTFPVHPGVPTIISHILSFFSETRRIQNFPWWGSSCTDQISQPRNWRNRYFSPNMRHCEQWQKNHHILVSHRQVRTPANIWISHNSQTPPKSGPHLVAHTFDWSRTRSWPSWLHQAIHRLLPHSFLFKRQVILVIWFQQIEAQSPQDFGLLPAPSESNSPSNPTRKISRGHTHCEKRSPPRRALTRRPKQEMHSSFASLPLHSCHRKGSPISHLGGVFPSRFSNSIWCAHHVTRDDMVEVDPSLFVYDDNSFDPISDPTKLRIIMVFEIVGTFTCSRQGKDGEAFGKNRITDLVF